MKKFLASILILMFFAVSCNSSKKSGNDADIMPDEDEISDGETPGDADKEGSDDTEGKDLCKNIANSTGEYIEYYDYDNGTEKKYKCGCFEDSFDFEPGCRKISYANICTGIQSCFTSWQMMEHCPGPGEDFDGQDAQYVYCLQQDFSTNNSVSGETTFIDNNLQIEWMSKISDSAYIWNDAVKYCEDLNYGGHDDWRLPLPHELMVAHSILSISNDVYLWSSQTWAGGESFAWRINPKNGTIDNVNKLTPINVRCVRGRPKEAPTSFEIIGNGLIADRENGFLWDTSKFTREKSWQYALELCERSTTAGFTNWRLPNINELASLVDFTKSGPDHGLPYSGHPSYLYLWSSTTQRQNIEDALTVLLPYGEILNRDKSDSYNVFCVRNEYCKENYFWNGKECVGSPCSGEPCKKDVHSDGVCHFESTETYSCGCVENYFWDGVKCVNPCDAEPCKNHEHSNNKCVPRDKMHYTCGCAEGFWWWGQNKGCLEKKPDLAHICTGQTKCYDYEKEIECPAKGEKFYGQDAQYADLGYCAPPDYTVERKVEDEPVVIDNYTGLSWQQKVYSPGASVPWSNYKNYCNNSTYGGYDDWRLPSLIEYRTIMDFGRHHPNIDPKYFPDTPPKYFVTSIYISYGCGELPYPIPARWVYLIDFDHFDIIWTEGCSEDPYFDLPARCVRGNESFGERSMSEISVSETKSLYVDNKNDLLWAGAPGGEKWDEALDYCENMTFAGLSDWRLTNINESSLFMENLNNIDPVYSYYISSTTEDFDPVKSVQNLLKTRGNYMLCVRDNPCETGQFWDGTKCMKNPCADLPCKDIKNSDKKECTPVSEELYSCSCNYYYDYYWNFNSMKCTHNCNGNPCRNLPHSTKECFDDEMEGYTCGCEEGYSWDSTKGECR